MSINRFDGPPLALGSIYGVRTFSVRSSGTLCGPITGYHWKSGVNKAECRFPGFGFGSNHQPAVRNCTCGFYAFHKAPMWWRISNDADIESQILGIVEGYGKCSIGPKGFRAEKAEIVALIVSRFWFSASFIALAALVTWCVGFVCFTLESGGWLVAGSFCMMQSAALVTLHLAFNPSLPRARYQAIRERYPEIPIYRSKRKAFKHHPLGRKTLNKGDSV